MRLTGVEMHVEGVQPRLTFSTEDEVAELDAGQVITGVELTALHQPLEQGLDVLSTSSGSNAMMAFNCRSNRDS
jgi:hypothetical protein